MITGTKTTGQQRKPRPSLLKCRAGLIIIHTPLSLPPSPGKRAVRAADHALPLEVLLSKQKRKVRISRPTFTDQKEVSTYIHGKQGPWIPISSQPKKTGGGFFMRETLTQPLAKAHVGDDSRNIDRTTELEIHNLFYFNI